MKTRLEKLEYYLELAKHHQKADMFIQGEWLQEEKEGDLYKGCMHGCLIQSERHVLYKTAEAMENPLWMSHLTEKIFEGLSADKAVLFPVASLEAMIEGEKNNVDLKLVYRMFFYYQLMDKKNGQINFVDKGSDQHKAIIQCAELFRLDLLESAAMSAVSSAAMSAASSAAMSAASSAAMSAELAASSAAMSAVSSAARLAESAAMSAAMSAAESAESAARSAAWSAESAASSAAESHYDFLSDLLLKLLSTGKFEG